MAGDFFTNPIFGAGMSWLTGLWASNEQKKASAANPLQSLRDNMNWRANPNQAIRVPPAGSGRVPQNLGDFTNPANIAGQLVREGQDAYSAALTDYNEAKARGNQAQGLLGQRVREGLQGIADVGAGIDKARATLGGLKTEARAMNRAGQDVVSGAMRDAGQAVASALQMLKQTEQNVSADRAAWVDASVSKLAAARTGIESAADQMANEAIRAIDEAGGSEYDRQAARRMVQIQALAPMMQTWSQTAIDTADRYATFLQEGTSTLATQRIAAASDITSAMGTLTEARKTGAEMIKAGQQAVIDIGKAQAEIDANKAITMENLRGALRTFEWAGHTELRNYMAGLARPTEGYLAGVMQFTLGTLAALNEDANLISNEMYARETGQTNTLASAITGGLQFGAQLSMFNQNLAFQQDQADKMFGLGAVNAATNVGSSLIGEGGLPGWKGMFSKD